MGLLQATAANMLEMIGIGPFITIPIIIAAMGGPQAMIGWVFGAIIAVCDGLIWAELGAAMPGSGGSYHYLQQAYGPRRLGRLMSFLFIWQTVGTAPFSIASGAVGFSNYTRYLWASMTPIQGKLLSVAVCAACRGIALARHPICRAPIGRHVVCSPAYGWMGPVCWLNKLQCVARTGLSAERIRILVGIHGRGWERLRLMRSMIMAAITMFAFLAAKSKIRATRFRVQC